MSIARKIKHAFRGGISLRSAALETARRGSSLLRGRFERWEVSNRRRPEQTVDLAPPFARITADELLSHFRARTSPKFFSGFELAAETLTHIQRQFIPEDSAELLAAAHDIVEKHRWPLLGYGVQDFGAEIDWLRDPLSELRWPLDYPADLALARCAGADVRVLWELNRLGHLLTLGRAYTLTTDDGFADECFRQIESWRQQNKFGYGPNWCCAMEVALRAMNLVGALELFRRAPALTAERVTTVLALLARHGEYIRRHLEFSYIATGNHYLSDVAGLLWLGIYLPELRAAEKWRRFGLRELLREMDTQVLPDGADDEASTGYHRFVTELFLYSFILCRANGIEIEGRYWQRLRSLLEYLRVCLRPDGRAPLVGDTDGGRALPLVRRSADDHAFVLGIGAALFREPRFKIDERAPEEVFWLLGPEGVQNYAELETTGPQSAKSADFEHAGVCVLREDDLYLLLSGSGAGLSGRGAHGHNDALSVEVSACGTAFIVDPGSYVYTADLRERHLFRSTAYHSTVQVDSKEQNVIHETTPFVRGDQARPRVTHWHTGPDSDVLVAEHRGYARLPEPVTHRRRIDFHKRERCWLIQDELVGAGIHEFNFRFHLAPGLSITVRPDEVVQACAKISGARLLIVSLDLSEAPQLEPRFSSREYGQKEPSVSICWHVRAVAPFVARFALIPVCAGEDEGQRTRLIERLAAKPIANPKSQI